MAESKNNIITHGLSGTIGDLIVFRQRAGKTVVANVPRKSEIPPSKAQVQVQTEFKMASIYAVTALKDPKTKAIYEAKAKPGQSAYNVAIRDFFHAPDISNVNVTGYNGKAGDMIMMRVTDDVMVTGVQVRIENTDGSLLEEGAAMIEDNGLDYLYTATKDNPKVQGSTLIITATDLPDNKAESITTL